MAANSRTSTQHSASTSSTTLFGRASTQTSSQGSAQNSTQSSTPASSVTNVTSNTPSSSSNVSSTLPLPVSRTFKSALTKFRSRLSGDQLLDFKDMTYEKLCVEIMKIQHDQENTRTMRNLNRIKGLIEAMSQFGKVVEVFLNVSDVIAFIWGPMKFLLLAAHNFSESFDILLDAYESIGDNLPLLAEYEALFNNPKMLLALEHMYMDILEFHQEAMHFFSGKLWKKLLKSTWKNFDTKFSGILKKLERHKELIVHRARVSHLQRYQVDMDELRKYYKTYEKDMETLKTNTETLVKENMDKKNKETAEWLATGFIADDIHQGFLDVRKDYSETGKWILDHNHIKSWMSEDDPVSPVVWMHGMPGAGKTILASVLIEECLKKKFITSYMYCSDHGNDSNTAVGIVRALINQLVCQQQDVLLPYIHSKINGMGEKPLRSFKKAKSLLQDVWEAVSERQYLIIDGLDECDKGQRKLLLETILSIISKSQAGYPGKLRLLIVSQDWPDIKKLLRSQACSTSNAQADIDPATIALSPADNQKDIRTFVRHMGREIKRKHDLEDQQVEFLREVTVSRANGMFLYAELVTSNLLQQTTREDLLLELHDRFPEGIREAYERIIARIKTVTRNSPRVWKKAKKLLGWMVCAKRPLTWNEINVALSIDPDRQTLELEDKGMRDHIYDICGSLVRTTGDHVYLVHSTAKEYIMSCNEEIYEPSVECELSILCLRYLTFSVFRKDVDPAQLRRLILQGHLAFQDYAISKWFYHLNAFVEKGVQIISPEKGVEVSPVDQELKVVSPEGDITYISPDDVVNMMNSGLKGVSSNLAKALDDFMYVHEDEEWDESKNVAECEKSCSIFKACNFHNNLVMMTSHIYTFQTKGFEARQKISLQALEESLERNRKELEELPKTLKNDEMALYDRYYDKVHRYKCPKVTCMYFSQGFKDAKTRAKHVNVHERPFQCEEVDCVANEYGFANTKDLDKHKRTFHPEDSELAVTFKPVTNNVKASKTWACVYCGQSFTRNVSKIAHENSHKGIRPFSCNECGRTFTRKNDCTRHQKLHDRK